MGFPDLYTRNGPQLGTDNRSWTAQCDRDRAAIDRGLSHMMASEMGEGLQIQDLRVAYHRDIEILRGVNIGAMPGQITVIIGPNGAGKSTLLRAIFGLAPVVGG